MTFTPFFFCLHSSIGLKKVGREAVVSRNQRAYLRPGARWHAGHDARHDEPRTRVGHTRLPSRTAGGPSSDECYEPRKLGKGARSERFVIDDADNDGRTSTSATAFPATALTAAALATAVATALAST